jgi:hypothetical protein
MSESESEGSVTRLLDRLNGVEGDPQVAETDSLSAPIRISTKTWTA